jgi:hypothetical protein
LSDRKVSGPNKSLAPTLHRHGPNDRVGTNWSANGLDIHTSR